MLAGVEREWRRKTCTENVQAWSLSFREASRPAVYLLRTEGVPRPQNEVRASSPLRGRISVDPIEGRASLTALTRRAVLLGTGGVPIKRLDRVQLQRWDDRGLVLAGREPLIGNRQLAEAWQS